MRVLHVSHRYWPYPGGSERHLQAICERMVQEGHEVAVYTTNALDLEYFWNPAKRHLTQLSDCHNGVSIVRFPIRHLPVSRLSFGGLRYVAARLSAAPVDLSSLLRRISAVTPFVPGLRAALRTATDFDVVHGMNVGFDGLLQPALEAARRLGVPFVVTPLIHLGETGESAVRVGYTMRHQLRLIGLADMVLAQTEIESGFLIDSGVKPSLMVRAGVGVEPSEVLGGVAERFRQKYGIDRPFVFCLGATAFDKGTFHLVEAMATLWQRGIDIDLVLAGPKMDAFERFYQMQPDSTKTRCHVLGMIPEDDKKDLLAAGDILAMPSRTDSFGIVFLEAWLYAKPVIGAIAGGIPEVIDDAVDGYLVPFGDVNTLSARIAELVDRRHVARSMGEAGRSKVLERYTWDHIYPVVRDAFHTALDARRGTGA